MIGALKAFIARHWPVLRLRTILFGTLLFVAALPGFGAIFLRVYENALVRRTEGELVAQSAALAAGASVLWGGRTPQRAGDPADDPEIDRDGAVTYHELPTGIDLRSSPILAPRPPAQATRTPPVLQAETIAKRLIPAFQETKETTLSSIIMLDANGTVLNGPDKARSLASLPEVRAALKGNAATVLRLNESYISRYAFEWLSRASNIRLHHARPIRVDGRTVGVLLVSRSPRALFRGMYEDRGKIALGVVVIFMMLVGLSGILSRAIVRPIENLSRTTRALATGRRADPVRPSLQVVEIRDLFTDFEAMADSIDKRSRYLRDFASSVSHEFKTPLAGIRGAVELLQDHGAEMSAADRERFLGNVAADAERLSRLVRRLMELAQADLHQQGADAWTDPKPILASIADGLAGGDFAIRLDLPKNMPLLAIDERALEAIVTTLVDNARQSGATELTISFALEDGAAAVNLIDNGPGISAADRDRIFDPFFTTRRETGGTGLGLSIARSLAESCRGALLLVPSDRGAHFRLLCGLRHAPAR
ncbi:MAG: HAMP domain-containing histidine kinase [Sphingobium sp.]|nr:HAMP domain-containing histidine kinase [Sphingobium sp.]